MKKDKAITTILKFYSCTEAERGVFSADLDELPLSGEYFGQVGLRASNMNYLCPYVL